MSNDLADEMRRLAIRLAISHAEFLADQGEVRALRFDPCPRCEGRVIASDQVAKCVSGCGWSYRAAGPEPVASRRADQ